MASSAQDSGGIVIVDDNADNLHVLGGMLQQAGFKVRPALSGEMALPAIRTIPPDLILLDIRMPGMDGYEVCARLKADAHSRDIPIIFISALQETEDKLAAFRAGGVDYISKPFQIEEVLARVRAHVQLQRMRRDLEGLVAERTRELQAAVDSLRESRRLYGRVMEQTIQAMALTIEKRDPYTAGHQQRVSLLATAIAGEMGLPADRVEGLRLGAAIHDIGKIHLPAEVLSRPGRLSEIEFALIKTHAEVGHDIVAEVDFPWPVAEMILQHHERLDGSGYPRGLRGDAIIVEAQILAVADVVEAMASHRPYRAAQGIDQALAEIRRGAGTIYSPEIVAACLRLFLERGFQLPPSMVAAPAAPA